MRSVMIYSSHSVWPVRLFVGRGSLLCCSRYLLQCRSAWQIMLKKSCVCVHAAHHVARFLCLRSGMAHCIGSCPPAFFLLFLYPWGTVCRRQWVGQLPRVSCKAANTQLIRDQAVSRHCAAQARELLDLACKHTFILEDIQHV